MWRSTISLLAVILASTSLSARPPGSQAASTSQVAPVPEALAPGTDAADQPPSTESAGFTYSPEGRRDPFVSLVGRGAGTLGGSIGARPAGLAGLAGC